jgi:hypothetical protein
MITLKELQNIANDCSTQCNSFVVYDKYINESALLLIDLLINLGCSAKFFNGGDIADVLGVIILCDYSDMEDMPLNLGNSDQMCFFYNQVPDTVFSHVESYVWCLETQSFKYHNKPTMFKNYLAQSVHSAKNIIPPIYKEFVNTLSMNRVLVLYAGPHSPSSFLAISTQFVKELINDAISKGIKNIVFANSEETLQGIFLQKAHRIMALFDDSINYYYSTGCVTGADSYLAFCSEHNIKPRLRILSSYTFEMINKSGEVRKVDLDSDYQIKLREKKFLCFNRIPRLQRLILLAEMLDRNLIKDSFYSFSFDAHLIFT